MELARTTARVDAACATGRRALSGLATHAHETTLSAPAVKRWGSANTDVNKIRAGRATKNRPARSMNGTLFFQFLFDVADLFLSLAASLFSGPLVFQILIGDCLSDGFF